MANKGSERMEHDEEGADGLRGLVRHHLPRDLDSRGNPGDNPGLQGGTGHLGKGLGSMTLTELQQKATELCIQYPSKASKGHLHPKTDSRRDPSPERGDCLLRPIQEFHVQRAPRRLLDLGNSRDPSQCQLLGRPTSTRQMGRDSGPGEGVLEARSRSGSQDPLCSLRSEFFGDPVVVADGGPDAGDTSEVFSSEKQDGISKERRSTTTPGRDEHRGGEDGPGCAGRCGEGGPSSTGPLGHPDGQVQHDGGPENGVQVSGDDIFYDCFEGKDGPMDVGEIEGWARNLRKAKDFSFSSCEGLLRHFCPHGAGRPCRGAHTKEDAKVTAGAFAHGSFYGVIGVTYKYPETIRYLNAFLKTLGLKDGWTALSIGWNCRSALHRDAHNARDRKNLTVTFGEFQGGRVWVEDSPLPVLQGRDEAPKEPYVLKLPNGDSVKGGWYDTYKNPTTFPGHLRHFVEDWEGDRFVITAYTPRGRDALSVNERDLLRSFGFPVGHAEVHGNPPLSPADREAAVRPKKSVRKGLWKQAMQASAMLTLSMTAVSSYFSELFSSEAFKGPAILEIGGVDMTSRVADWGRDVVEPIDLDTFLGESGLDFVSNLTSSLEPQVLWINAVPYDNTFAAKASRAMRHQLQRGGIAVLKGSLEDMGWDIEGIKIEFSGYDVQCQHVGQGQEVTLRPQGEQVSGTVDQEAFVQDVVVPEGQPVDPGPLGASAISFDPEVPQHIGAALARLHQNMGHPDNKDLTRHLRYAGADQAVLKASKSLKCQTCQRCKRPGTPRPATLPSLLDFNQMVSLNWM